MFGIVNIGGRDVEMTANGASVYRYKQVFREDFLVLASNSDGGIENVELFVKMGYIMAKQAEKADFSKLNFDSFLEWAGEFEPNALEMAAGDIGNIYAGNSETSVYPKAKADRQSE